MDQIFIHSSWILVVFVGISAIYRLLCQVKGAQSTCTPPSAIFFVWLAIAFLAWFSFHNLATHSGTLLTWECEVTTGFLSSGSNHLSVWQYLLDLASWQDGTVARGDQSFYFGLPTYAIFQSFGYSVLYLRICAAIAAVLAAILVYISATRIYGPLAGACAALLFALNPAVIYYAKYGTSLSGTILGLLLVFVAIIYWRGLKPNSLIMPYLVFLLAFLATLNYSPARVVVLIMLGIIVVRSLVEIARNPEARGRSLHALAAVCICASVLTYLEVRSGGAGRFLNARGEQAFNLMHNQEYVAGELGDTTQNQSFATKLLFFKKIIQNRAAELWNLFSPFSTLGENAKDLRSLGDPPDLKFYQAGFAPFIVLGIFLAALNIGRIENQILLGWLFLGAAPLLLTNRVDLHRVFVLLVPLLFFAAHGLATAINWVASARHLSWIPNICLALLSASALAYDLRLLSGSSEVPKAFAEIKRHIEAAAPNSVLIGARNYCGDIYWLNFEMAERERNTPDFNFEVLDPALSDPLINSRLPNSPDVVGRALPKLEAFRETILYPSSEFKDFGKILQNQAFQVENQGELLIIRNSK